MLMSTNANTGVDPDISESGPCRANHLWALIYINVRRGAMTNLLSTGLYQLVEIKSYYRIDNARSASL